jgi:sporulation protein YlmC with PRC-barrel domain
MRLSAILGLEVATESGDALGRVHDVRAELRASSLVVTGLVVGRAGIAERLGIGAPGTHSRIHAGKVIQWKQIVRVDRRGIVVKDGTTPR